MSNQESRRPHRYGQFYLQDEVAAIYGVAQNAYSRREGSALPERFSIPAAPGVPRYRKVDVWADLGIMPPTEPMLPKAQFYSTAQVSYILRVSRGATAKAAKDGDLPAYRGPGGDYFFGVAEICDLLKMPTLLSWPERDEDPAFTARHRAVTTRPMPLETVATPDRDVRVITDYTAQEIDVTLERLAAFISREIRQNLESALAGQTQTINTIANILGTHRQIIDRLVMMKADRPNESEGPTPIARDSA